jgi:hypothetical protein
MTGTGMVPASCSERARSPIPQRVKLAGKRRIRPLENAEGSAAQGATAREGFSGFRPRLLLTVDFGDERMAMQARAAVRPCATPLAISEPSRHQMLLLT